MTNVTLHKERFSFFCEHCKKPSSQKINNYRVAKARNQKLFFCSLSCSSNYHNEKNKRTKHKFNCTHCNKILFRTPGEFKKSKSGNQFCSKSCAAFYNNKRRKKSRRSKIEINFFNSLKNKFPNLTILPNDKTMLNGLEVDVAIPELKLAIEWNGIVHFQPIYGEEKLKKIQNKDKEKLKIASRKDINLVVIADLVSTEERLQEAIITTSEIIKSLFPKPSHRELNSD